MIGNGVIIDLKFKFWSQGDSLGQVASIHACGNNLSFKKVVTPTKFMKNTNLVGVGVFFEVNLKIWS